jgi:hypothetical protein
MSQWLPTWWFDRSLIEKLMLLLAALAVPLMCIRHKNWQKIEIIFGVLLIAGLLFWLMTAPALRFQFATIAFLIVITGRTLVLWLIGSNNLIMQRALLLLVLSYVIYTNREFVFSPMQFLQYAWKPPLVEPIPPDEKQQFQLGDHQYVVPGRSPWCRYNTFCTPWPNPQLTPRGNNIYAGFRIKQ